MAVVITNLGRQKTLEYVLGKRTTTESLILKLYSNDVIPSDDDVIGLQVESFNNQKGLNFWNGTPTSNANLFLKIIAVLGEQIIQEAFDTGGFGKWAKLTNEEKSIVLERIMNDRENGQDISLH
jgi:hypothetical protein